MTENKDYIKFLTDLKSKIRQVQYKAYRAVNTELISLYWDIGQSIVDKQEKLGWGQKIIQKLSDDLQKEFPKNSGFSERNLKYMRQFYLEYKDRPKMQLLVAQIPWSHNIIILDKTKNDYDDKVKLPDENPSIGLILCKEKDNIVVEYALRNITKPMGVAKYYLTRELPADLVNQLPAPEVIETKLKELEEENEK